MLISERYANTNRINPTDYSGRNSLIRIYKRLIMRCTNPLQKFSQRKAEFVEANISFAI